MKASTEKVLRTIEDHLLFAPTAEARELADILSGLRGPDTIGGDYKACTTNVVRSVAFPRLKASANAPIPGVRCLRATGWDMSVDQRVRVGVSSDILHRAITAHGTHFVGHIQSALKALQVPHVKVI